jgi:hypothetical protein
LHKKEDIYHVNPVLKFHVEGEEKQVANITAALRVHIFT